MVIRQHQLQVSNFDQDIICSCPQKFIHLPIGAIVMPQQPQRYFDHIPQEYHRGLKQYCSVEHAQGAYLHARNHISLAIRAFLRLEMHWFDTGHQLVRSQN